MVFHGRALVKGRGVAQGGGIGRNGVLPCFIGCWYHLGAEGPCHAHHLPQDLREFWEGHPESQSPLSRWYTIVRKTDFKDFNELRTTFPNADWVGGLIVFNIGGNKYRLIASIHFNRARVYVRHVLTHEEYGQGAWKP
jgi:mRNA interferase HigB